MNNKIKKIYNYIDDKLEEHVNKIQNFLKQPSISYPFPTGYGIKECVVMIKGYLQRLGCKGVETIKTREEGHPIIYGEYDVGADATLIIYHMYDTKPVVPRDWTLGQPFDADLVDIPPYGRCIVARGAINSKGPLRAFLNALESIKAVDEELTVNLKFVIEGEEEMGSTSVSLFVNRYVDRLRDADGVWMPMANSSGRINLGGKGEVFLEMECAGEHWSRGPIKQVIHGSNKAWIDNPVWRMIHALATMTSKDGNKVWIDGFYDEIIGPSEEDIRIIDRLVERFNEEETKNAMGVKSFIDDAHAKDAIMKYCYSPTFNIEGIFGGYLGEGWKNIVPHKVTCRLNCMLVPNQDIEALFPKIRKHLDEHGYGDIKLSMRNDKPDGNWWRTDPNSDLVKAVVQTYKSFDIEPEIWPLMGGFAPFYLFTSKPLNLPLVLAGLGHGGNAHAPDEYFVIDGTEKVKGLSDCEKSYVAMLYNYAKIARDKK